MEVKVMRKISIVLSIVVLVVMGLCAVSAQQEEKREERRIEIRDGQVKIYVNGKEVPFAEAFAFGGGVPHREMKIIIDDKEINIPAFGFGFQGGDFQNFTRRFALGGRLPDKRVDLNANDVGLSEALDRLFKDTGYGVKFEDSVNKETKVTAVLKNVQFDTALRAVCESAGVGYRPDGEKALLITKNPTPRFGAFATFPPAVFAGPIRPNLPNLPNLQAVPQRPLIARGRGGSGSALVLDGRTIRSGTENDEYFVELEGPAKATITVLDKDGKALRTNALELKEGKQKAGIKLTDIPSGGSGVIALEIGRAKAEIKIEEGGRKVSVKASSSG
jgi:hypothetical protein